MSTAYSMNSFYLHYLFSLPPCQDAGRFAGHSVGNAAPSRSSLLEIEVEVL